MKFILGKKIEMSQIFDEEGNVIPVTLIEAGPCFVTQINPVRNAISNGVKKQSIQIGFERLKDRKVKKPAKGRPYRYLREFLISNSQFLKIGDKIDVSIFKEGDIVKVSGISKGKGFAGAVKRWGFHGRPASHGTKHEERTIGSVGASFPERVIKGKKMPGRMGAERVTVKNLKVAKVDSENNLLAVKGALPGPRGTLLEIRA